MTGIIASDNGGSGRPQIEPGSYIARCYSMVLIGTITEKIKNKQTEMCKVRITWELPELLHTFKEEYGPQPLVISKEFNVSLNEKSNLRAFLKNWRGKDFTPEQAKAFDITVLLGVPCMLQIINVERNGKIYDEISSVMNVHKNLPIPPQVNPTRLLTFGEGWNQELFDSLPDFIKTKIRSSKEYKAQFGEYEHKDPEPEYNQPDQSQQEDDLPF